MTASLLAHSGGFSWDEMLFLLAPIVIFAVLMVAAKRKAAAEESDAEGDEEGGPGPEDGTL